jgi:hypothetical protein
MQTLEIDSLHRLPGHRGSDRQDIRERATLGHICGAARPGRSVSTDPGQDYGVAPFDAIEGRISCQPRLLECGGHAASRVIGESINRELAHQRANLAPPAAPTGPLRQFSGNAFSNGPIVVSLGHRVFVVAAVAPRNPSDLPASAAPITFAAQEDRRPGMAKPPGIPGGFASTRVRGLGD